MSLRERKKLAAWRAIHTAALSLFHAQGYEATTIEQIAAAANVSRATFFNYFPNKESVVFDQDPEQRDDWRALMAERPAGEPIRTSLIVIMMEFSESLRDRMPVLRRLKARSPALAQATQTFGEQFAADLRDWVLERAGDHDALRATLLMNIALVASSTAYQTWPADADYDDYMARLKQCLHEALSP